MVNFCLISGISIGFGSFEKNIEKYYLLQFGYKYILSVIELQNFWICFLQNDAIFLNISLHFEYIKHILVMDFSTRLKHIREEKGIKREQVAQKIGTSAAIIGRYERGERTPSIDIAKKIAQALEVSLDYLVGEASVLVQDKSILNRIEEIANLPEENKNYVLGLIDMCLRDFKTKQTFAQ